MTLEHIPDPARFVGMVRRSVDAHAKTIVFFQVPNLSRILHDVAFWDIYYEHCSYFSRPSLAALFRRRGFEVLDLREEYDGQYLCLEARPGRLPDGARAEEEYGELESLKRDVAHFAASCRRRREEWKSRLEEFRRRGQTVVIWGAGSKAVAFLTTLQARDAIGHAVDINPYKHGTYLPGGGQQILRPELLRELRPDVVIVMNPIYRHEIQRDLEQMGLSPLLMTV
jgi:hypothetical protein